MLEKIKAFVKKNKIFVLAIAGFVLLVVIILVAFLMSKNGVEDPEEVGQEEIVESRPTYENYQMNLSDEILTKLDTFETQHDIYIVNTIDHFEWVDKFVKALNKPNLEYEKKHYPPIKDDPLHTIDQSNYFWYSESDFITYDVADDMLSLELQVGIFFPGIRMTPSDEASVLKGLQDLGSNYFSDKFAYEINSITREGNDYRVDYSRTLGERQIFIEGGSLYLILTPDGRLKEGTFLLGEFQRTGSVRIKQGSEIGQNLMTADYPRRLSYNFSDPELQYELFGVDFYSETGLEKGLINFDFVDLVYNYRNKFQEIISPTFIFKGLGNIEFEDNIMDADFLVFID